MYRELRNDGKLVKCYKPHDCEWCGEMIKINEEAISRNYVWEDTLISGHQHPECYNAMGHGYCLDGGFELGMFERGQTYDEYLESE